MDLQEWEILPDDGFLEIHDDGGKQIFSRKFVNDSKNVFNMNYFTCSSQKSDEFVESASRQLLHVPVQLESRTDRLLHVAVQLESRTDQDPDREIVKEVTSVHIKAPDIRSFQSDQDQISQVFFKKMKENEFVDMKMDSPKSNNNNNNKGIIHHQVNSIKNQEGSESENDREIVIKNKKHKEDDENWEEKSGNLKIWKWRLSGIGAICSLGVAAATICIIFLGGRQKNKHLHHQHSQKLQFHLYTDHDKRINEAVRNAGRLNEAISAVTGIPIATAHFTVGGYCDAF